MKVSRLALRFYWIGLVQLIVIALGFFAVIEALRPDPPPLPPEGAFHHGPRPWGRERVRPPPDEADDRAAPVSELRPPHGRPEGPLPHVGPPPGLGGPRRLPGRPPLPSPAWVVPFVLLVVGATSWILARSVTAPLRQIALATERFGKGELGARASLARKDELGDVGRAFDVMAERISTLIASEKELIANVSHELRTPLARIRVALDLAVEGDSEAARESLAFIGEDLAELERLIDDVLVVARLGMQESSGALPPLRRVEVAVPDLIARIEERFRQARPDRTLEVSVAPGDHRAMLDPVLFRRVLDNLIDNAVKYSDGPIKLDVTREADAIALTVRDQGIGISEADQKEVFRAFFRADRSRTRTTGGLGLGLALVKRIVLAHGGTVELTSTPNVGTKVTVRVSPIGD